MKDEKDMLLWKQAKARTEFKLHFSVYLLVSLMLWLIWFFTSGIHSHPWPIYPTFGWGIGILSNYFTAYKFTSTAEKEYEKLKRQS